VKITTVRYGFTFNRSNFQSERIDLEAQIEPGESVTEAYYTLQAHVHTLGGDKFQADKARAAAERVRVARTEGKMTIVDKPLPQSNPPYKNDI
jgi:hypothetical protein